MTMSMKSLKVFVVDDDPDFAESLALGLDLEGHKVTLASSGEEAVHKFGEQDFDLTIMDVQMPGMNGVETLCEIRNIQPDAKVVMITGYGVEQIIKIAIAEGALTVLQKPVAGEVLAEILREVNGPQVVLVADDDPDFAEGIESILSDSGYEVIRAHTGQETISKVLDGGIDLLLLDVRMPDLGGLEVYRKLIDLACAPPTILLTGYALEESEAVQELLRLSARACLVKPVHSRELLKTIKKAA